MAPLLKRIFIAVIAIASVNCAEAQKIKKKKNADYVVTLTGDTVYCVITVPFFGKDIYSTADTSAALVPNEIKAYYTHTKNEYYRAELRPNENRLVFVQVLESGKINLYQDLVPNNVTGRNNAVWYITKGDGKLVELKRTKIAPGKEKKNDLEEMLMDNKNAYNAYVNDKVYSFDEARSLIRLYNTGIWQQGWPKTYDH